MESAMTRQTERKIDTSSIRFWDKRVEKYARQQISDMEAYEEKLKMTQAHLTPASSVLEFGCGTGSTALIHAAHVKHILAIDSSQKMVEFARNKAQESGVENVEFRAATVFDLPQDASFDVVMGLNVLHLIKEMDETIERCYELLAPGGVFISGTACIAHINFVLRWLLPLGGKLGLIPKVQFFDAAHLEASITRAGFQIMESRAFNKGGMSRFIIARK